ncbi:serine protease nudel isoform X2 [Ceratitis capitata]|uniref:serine protease nudel isoform X2 n=1 Tax=Ceratitis capitata TaxID=7213 RepID=UPI00032A283F|nr:serine protease nudel isoform X2 [Ceratitis capitata]
MAKIKLPTDDKKVFNAGCQRKCLKTTLVRVLAISGVTLMALMIILVYHAITLHEAGKHHPVAPTGPQYQTFVHSDNEKLTDERHVTGNEFDQNLIVQQLRSIDVRQRHGRSLPDPLDPVFLEHGPNFDSLYAKVRNKRTRIELGKLEKEYLRCKKESVNSSSCMVAFLKLYDLAKEISEKVDKMKEIFDDNEETLQRSNSSESTESHEVNRRNETDTTKDGSNDTTTAATTEARLITVTEAASVTNRNASANGEEEPIHYNWIIDGQDEDITDQAPLKENVTEVSDFVSTTTMAAIKKVTNITENLPLRTSRGPTSTSTEATPTESGKNHNDTSFTHTENESHKISWILDGYENDNETMTVDKPIINETTAKPTHMNVATENSANETTTPSTIKVTVHEKPEKISWIIDGHHDDDKEKAEEDEEEFVANTTKSNLSKEIVSIGTEKVLWILDENDENDENVETTAKETPKSTTQIKDKSDRISWIIDGHDDESVTSSTTRLTTSSTRNIFEELEEVTEGVEKEEEKLRKLKYDAMIEQEQVESKTPRTTVAEQPTTTAPLKHATSSLVMNQTVHLTNTAGITITYGGDCMTTTTTKPEQLEQEKARASDTQDRSHPLDHPSSAENMLEVSEKYHKFKPFKAVSVSPKLKNITSTTTSPYNAEMWEKLFRQSSAVQHQQDELIDTFGPTDIQSMLEFGAKLNTANTNTQGLLDSQFLSLCDQIVARRLLNKGMNTEEEPFTPAPNPQFTSRGPGGFPVTGETMKATAQFIYNPNFGMPTIPICFYITPANFRMANQSPMWSNNFAGMSGGFSNPMGLNTPNGVFFVPQNFGPTGNFFGPSGSTGTGGQTSMGNVFGKNAAARKQQQQFFCTYMQNNGNNSPSGGSGRGGLGGSGINGMGFRTDSFKMRTSGQNLTNDIIYASYTDIPDHLGHADHFQCSLPEQVACYGGKECIQESAWCDGFVDCADGSDEAACRCIDRLASKRICDGYADCPMGEDELGCFGCNDLIYSCYDGPEDYAAYNRSTVSMCYSATERCDGVMNCLNGRDELECNIIVDNVLDHMSHAASSSSGFLFHNYRGEWFPVCNNAQKWASEACANEAEHSATPNVTFREITLSGTFIEPTLVGQARFPQSCQQRDAHDKLVDQAAYVDCMSTTQCGLVKKKVKTPFRRKRSGSLSKLHKSIRQQQEQRKRENFNGRIVGGSYSSPLQWPFVVAIYRDGKFHCGGTIYSEKWILSAAHCVINYHKYYYEIHAGMLRRTSFAGSTQIRTVSHIIVHQAYERRSMRNDLSLLAMAEPLKFNRWVKPICLPDVGRTTAGADWIWGPEENTLCTVVGWGAVREKGPGSDQLREVIVPIRKQCTELEDKESEDVCAGDADGGRDACQGDSGGPLFCRSVNNTEEWYLAGVVSHGNGCARKGEFGAYTRVALYLDWIEMASKYRTKLQPRLTCPGYTCVWGGNRCIPMKRRCDRIVDCLGGEDEVGCIYNFIPDLVGSSKNISSTTESDYHPEEVVKTTHCKAADTARNAGVEEENEVEVDDEKASTERRVSDDEESITNASTATITQNITKIESSTNDATEYTTDFSTTESSDIDETNATPQATFADLTTSETISTQSTPSIETTADSTTTEDVITSTSTTQITTTTEMTTNIPSTTTIVTTTEITTTPIGTTEPSMADTTESSLSTDTTTVSLTPFDVENLVTTSTTGSTFSTTTSPAKIWLSQATSTEATEATETTTKISKTSTEKPHSFINATLPGKFVCQRIPQIVELINRCDRVLDCEDGTDEDSCSCRDYLKGSLNILICDGKVDCEDLTDEENCGNCQDSEFLCPLSKTCVPLRKRCDNNIDCDFKEDEKDCFALTNGKKIILDADRRPLLTNAGIFSRNNNGTWRVVCSHEISHSDGIASTAASVCVQLGFKSLKFYNTTRFIGHNAIIPIHPDIQKKQKLLQAHFSTISADNHQFSGAERQFRANDQAFKARTQFIEHTRDECLGLFVECEAKAYKMEPLKTISAGEQLAPAGVPSTGLEPALETHGKPNVFVTPPSTLVLVTKKDEVLDKLDGVIASRKNMTLLVDNKLHEAVEELHWPWVVDIYVDGRLWCVGALVDKYWVLVHESCHYGVRFNTNYIAVLLGGGKTKGLRHKSTHEQIQRVDCFEQVPKSDVLLYHLEKPARFTHHVLPTFFPEFSTKAAGESQQCIGILHDEQSGRIKAVLAVEEHNDALCRVSDMSCYRLIERTPPRRLLAELGVSDEDFASLSEEVVFKEDFSESNEFSSLAISRFATCTQFGKKNSSRLAFEPVDQGILACRQADSGWYPLALFDYNNTNCYSFKDSFALRTLEKVYGTIQSLIDQPKCEHPHEAPVCSTHRCALGDCLEEEQICNGFNDCHDADDEEKEMCMGQKKVCQPSELKCRSTYKCIPKTKFCDHVADCEDMTDEPTLCSCYTYLQATDPKKICDGIRNCWDKSDESPALCNCTENHFHCGVASKECVPRDFVCDKEPDCPNGEDEKYCFGLEFPKQIVTEKTGFSKLPQLKHKQLPQFGQVIEQTYGVWHTKCFPRSRPPDVNEVRQICKQLGFSPFKQPSYRIIDDVAKKVVETNEWPDQRGRSFGNDEESPLHERYRSATKAVVVSKFSPLNLNDDLTLFLKPSRPIAEVAQWNATDSDKCYRLEINCM